MFTVCCVALCLVCAFGEFEFCLFVCCLLSCFDLYLIVVVYYLCYLC